MSAGIPSSSRANRGNGERISDLSVFSCSIPASLGIAGPEDPTEITAIAPDISGEDKRGGVVEIDFNLANSEGVNIYSRRDGVFKFLARDTVPPYVDNRPMLVPGKPEPREYKAVFVVADEEVSQFGNEITANRAPLV
jgi:hypothetical protein